MSNPRTVFAATIVGVFIVGIVAAVATGDWLFLLWALAANVVVTSAVLVYGAVTAGARDEPDEAELVRLEEERLAELRRRGDPRRTTRAPRGR